MDSRSTPGSTRLRRLAAGILGATLVGGLVAPAAVMAVGMAPLADLIETSEDHATVTGNVLDNDTGVVRSAGYLIINATPGTLTVAEDGAYSFTPAANWNGTNVAVGYYFADDDNAVGGEVITWIRVTVTPVPDAPTAGDQAVSTNEDTAKAITLTGADADGDSLTFDIVTAPTHGAVTGTGPSRSYTPTANYNGLDSFTFTVTAGGETTAPATVSITVDAVNDLPVAAAQSVNATEDTALPIVLAGTDIETAVGSLTYEIVAQPAHGSLTGAGAERSYMPAADYSGPDSFTFKINDGTADSAAATVSITVASVNDLPVATAQSLSVVYKTAKSFTLAGTDVDGQQLTYAIVSQPTKGVLSGTAPNLTYTPTGTNAGADSFTFKVNDGAADSAPATVSITIADDVTAPVVAVPSVTFGAGRVNESAPLKITWSATDAGIGVISEYVVEAKVGAGAWTQIYAGTNTTITKLYAFGQRLQWRVKAKDSKNNQSGFTLSAVRQLAAYQGTSPVVTSGTWTKVASTASSGTTYYYTTTSGKYKSLTFSGIAVAFVAPRSSSGGRVTVKIDGSSYSLSTWKSGTTAVGQIIKARSLTSGTHSVRVTNAQGGRRANFDAFIVLR